jgi:hypothetical protein
MSILGADVKGAGLVYASSILSIPPPEEEGPETNVRSYGKPGYSVMHIEILGANF